MKRRLKSEISQAKGSKRSVEFSNTALKGKKLSQSTVAAQTSSDNTLSMEEAGAASKDFEDSLMKLASFAKGRIKYEDFTQRDKFNILDLFVNNEKTLVKIYEALFPHRAQAGGG